MIKLFLLIGALFLISSCSTAPTTYYTYFPNPTDRLRASAGTPRLNDLKFPIEKESKFHFFSGAQSTHAWVDDGNVSQALILYAGANFRMPLYSIIVAPFASQGSGTKNQKIGGGMFASFSLFPWKEHKWTLSPQISFAYSSSINSDSGCDSKIVTPAGQSCASNTIYYQREVSVRAREPGFSIPIMNQLDSTSVLTLIPAVYFSMVDSYNTFNLQPSTDFTLKNQSWNYSFMAHYSKSYQKRWIFFWSAGLGVNSVRTFRPGDTASNRKWLPTVDARFQF